MVVSKKQASQPHAATWATICAPLPSCATAIDLDVYYCPRPGKRITTILRVVFDGSSKAPGKLFLNDILFAGPNLNPNLSDILTRFRIHNVAIMSNIEKTFLQIQLRKDDRNTLRFLWYESTPKQGQALPPIRGYRMTRVPFGATCSPFLLAVTLKHHLECTKNIFKETASMLGNDVYVDDLVLCANTLEDAMRICNEAECILRMAGMNLRKWKSNDLTKPCNRARRTR